MSVRKETVTKQETISVYTCDDCGKDKISDPRTCRICRRHFCYDCVLKGQRDPDDYSDYPDWFCASCWLGGKKFRDEIDAINELAGETREKAMKAWRDAAIGELGEQE